MDKSTLTNISRKIIISFCATTALVTISYAQERGQGRGVPPKEAIEICKNKKIGSECKFSTPRGDKLSGICQNTPDNKYFVCMPEGGPKK